MMCRCIMKPSKALEMLMSGIFQTFWVEKIFLQKLKPGDIYISSVGGARRARNSLRTDTN